MKKSQKRKVALSLQTLHRSQQLRCDGRAPDAPAQQITVADGSTFDGIFCPLFHCHSSGDRRLLATARKLFNVVYPQKRTARGDRE